MILVSLSKLFCPSLPCISRTAGAWRARERWVSEENTRRSTIFICTGGAVCWVEEKIDRMEGDIPVPSTSFCVLVLRCFTVRPLTGKVSMLVQSTTSSHIVTCVLCLPLPSSFRGADYSHKYENAFRIKKETCF